MEYKKLPGTELTVSRACLGTMTFGDRLDAAAAAEAVAFAVGQGVNFVDTADIYPRFHTETAERIELLFRDACMLKNNVRAVSAATADVAQRLSRRLSLRQLMDLCALTAQYAGYVKRNANMALLVTAFCAKMRETAGR